MDKQSTDMKSARGADEFGSVPGFASLCEEIDQLFEDLALPGRITCVQDAPAEPVLNPPVEMKETADHYELAIELPGLERKDITVEFAGGVLSVAGKKRANREDHSGDCLISERSYGAFHRSFSLPHDVAPDQIGALYRQGVLMLTIGKNSAAESHVHTIEVT
jgi:HSP20 family protein